MWWNVVVPPLPPPLNTPLLQIKITVTLSPPLHASVVKNNIRKSLPCSWGGMWLPTTIRHSFHFKLEKPDNPHFECEKPDNLNFKLEKPDHLHFNREKPDHFRAGSGIVPFELGSHIYINCIKSAVHS